LLRPPPRSLLLPGPFSDGLLLLLWAAAALLLGSSLSAVCDSPCPSLDDLSGFLPSPGEGVRLRFLRLVR
jgi:hypothetical protein